MPEESRVIEKHNKLCIDCFHCKQKNNNVYCKERFFDNIDENKFLTLSPHDFDCPFWNEA